MSRRRRAAALLPVCVFAVAAGGPMTGAAFGEEKAVEPGEVSGGTVVKTGWWWAANDLPDQTLAAPPQASPPNVPTGALPVSAVGGEADKLFAIEFALDAEPGASATSVHLALREVADPGSNLNSGAAAVVACPVTDAFWADGEAAAWKARPAYDCARGVDGERDDTGVWLFDLTGLAAGWLAAESAQPASVVLVEKVDAPQSFQVVFDGVEADGIGLDAVTVAAKTAKDLPPAAGDNPTTAAGGSGSSGGVDTGGSEAVSSSADAGALADAGSPAADLDPALAAPAPEVSTDSTAVSAEEAVAASPVAAAAGPLPWYSGLPRGAFVLFPLALGLAYLAMLALGPDAQPSPMTTQRGVARALERFRRVGAQAMTRGARA